MAPEILNGMPYDYKVDMWSIGTMLFELVTGFTPFTGKNKPDLMRNVNNGVYKIPKKVKLSLSAFDFINRCLQYNPAKRMSAKEAQSHPFIQNAFKKNMESDIQDISLSFVQGQMGPLSEDSLLLKNFP
jgi:serine/threonine protein kinase